MPLANDHDRYEVDRIIAERKTTYRVRWTGYDASEDTWVDKTELAETAPKALTTWHTENQSDRVLRSHTSVQ